MPQFGDFTTMLIVYNTALLLLLFLCFRDGSVHFVRRPPVSRKKSKKNELVIFWSWSWVLISDDRMIVQHITLWYPVHVELT